MESDNSTHYSDIDMDVDMNDLDDLDISDDFVSSPINDDRTRVLRDLMLLFIRHKLTFVALEDTAKMLNQMPGAKVQIPTTKHLLIKEFVQMSSIQTRRYIYCSGCRSFTESNYKETSTVYCSDCNVKLEKEKFFIFMSLKSQLERVVRDNFEAILEFKRNVVKDTENISDCYNSGHLKNLLLTDENIFSLTMNRDGVQLQNSNNSSLWHVYLQFSPTAHTLFESKYSCDWPSF